MSIFPERDRKGHLTGFLIVKVMHRGQTTTYRTTDGKDAIATERILKAGGTIGNQSATKVPKPPEITIGGLLTHAKGVYRGTKDEVRSIARMENAFLRLGINQPLSSIRTKQLDLFVSSMRNDGFDPKTINRYLATISKAFKWAVAHELLDTCPTIPRLKESEGRMTFLSPEQAGLLVQWLRSNDLTDVAIVTEVLLVSGFRIQELLTRTPSDLRDGWLYLETGETKNDKGRAICLTEALGSSLAAMLASGLPTYQKIYFGLVRASQALGLPHVTPHVLRHTTASRLDALGFSTAQIQEYLGHKHIATTLKYAHVTKDSVKKASEALAEAISRPQGLLPPPTKLQTKSTFLCVYPGANPLFLEASPGIEPGLKDLQSELARSWGDEPHVNPDENEIKKESE